MCIGTIENKVANCRNIYIFGAFEISISFLRILKLRAVSCVALG